MKPEELKRYLNILFPKQRRCPDCEYYHPYPDRECRYHYCYHGNEAFGNKEITCDQYRKYVE